MKTALLFLVTVCTATVASACTCGPMLTPERAFETADIVFVGVALESGATQEVWMAPHWPLVVTTFEVEEMLKETRYKRQDPGRMSLREPQHNCAATFAPGQRYLVYAWWSKAELAESSHCAMNEIVTDSSASLLRVRAAADAWSPPSPLEQDIAGGDTLGGEGSPERASSPRWSLWLNVVLGILLVALLWRHLHVRQAPEANQGADAIS